MSVYKKESASFFSSAVNSMLQQTCPPTQFVLVCDGPLTPELDKSIQDFLSEYPTLFRVIRLPVNQGLGLALREGLSACDCELVARMDSDDIALPLRMEHQLAARNATASLSAVGGQIAEFVRSPRSIQSYRTVPISSEEIRRGIAVRNPMNHMTVLFRKSDVLSVGGYQDMKGFEDYYLWARMLKAGYNLANLPEICVLARVSEIQARRGGWNYFRQTIQLECALRACGLIGISSYYKNLLVRFCGAVLLPNVLRQHAYQMYLRQSEAPEMSWAVEQPSLLIGANDLQLR